MSIHVLPKQLNVEQAADAGEQFRGAVSLQEMDRLKEAIANLEQGKVTVELSLGVDEQGLRYMQGQITATLPLVCQRCLDEFLYNIDAQFTLSPVVDDAQAEKLPDTYEPILLIGSPIIMIATVVEDELLLNLPIAPMHAVNECKAKGLLDKHQEQQDEAGNEKVNPFHVLRNLKKD